MSSGNATQPPSRRLSQRISGIVDVFHLHKAPKTARGSLPVQGQSAGDASTDKACETKPKESEPNDGPETNPYMAPEAKSKPGISEAEDTIPLAVTWHTDTA